MKIADVFNNPKLYRIFQFAITSHRTSEVIRLQILKPDSVAKILDFGCGVGHYSDKFPDAEYLGIKPLARCVEQARKNYKNSNLKFIVGDHNNLKFIPNSSYDLIIAIGVLHHLDHSIFVEFIKESYRILKIGGRRTTIDPVRHEKQSRISRWVVQRDRGIWVRPPEGHLNTINEYFCNNTSYEIFDNLLRIPYDHIAIEATKIEEN
jgi:SAM-dependent methyltransferase